jgi:predicted small lipoprotein YifL
MKTVLRRLTAVTVLLAIGCVVAACGQKGDLVRPGTAQADASR